MVLFLGLRTLTDDIKTLDDNRTLDDNNVRNGWHYKSLDDNKRLDDNKIDSDSIHEETDFRDPIQMSFAMGFVKCL